MKSALDDEVPAWKLDVGDTIVAMVLAYDTYPSKYGEGNYHVATVRTAEDEFRLVIIAQVALRGLFGRLRPKVGETIKLKRLPDGEKARRYRMRVLGRTATLLYRRTSVRPWRRTRTTSPRHGRRH